MNTAPAVSVILPTYNRVECLPRSIGSVLNQSFRNLELILVDDGSTEDVQSTAAGFGDSRIVYVRREQRGGVAAARNTGVARARGTWLAFQDSDDEWLLDKLSLQMRALDEAGPEYALSVSGLLRVGGPGVRSYPPRPADWRNGLAHVDVLNSPFAYTQTWLVRRSAVVDAGGFDESMRIWDDWELLIRLSKHHRIQALPAPQVISPQRPDGLSRDGTRFTHDMNLILVKHAELLGRHPAQHARLQYTYGRLLATDGRLVNARAALRHAIQLEPRWWRPWALWAATLAGAAVVRRLLQGPQRVQAGA